MLLRFDSCARREVSDQIGLWGRSPVPRPVLRATPHQPNVKRYMVRGRDHVRVRVRRFKAIGVQQHVAAAGCTDYPTCQAHRRADPWLFRFDSRARAGGERGPRRGGSGCYSAIQERQLGRGHLGYSVGYGIATLSLRDRFGIVSFGTIRDHAIPIGDWG
jgi:hypothetical protein